MNYYYLISSLPDIVLEQHPKYFDITLWIREFKDYVLSKDRKYIHQLFSYYDYINICNLLLGKEKFNFKGNLSLDEIKAGIDSSEQPEYMRDIVEHFRSENTENLLKFAHRRFYRNIENECDNKFIRNWFTFNRLFHNIQSAYMSKKMGINVQKELVGLEDEIEVLVTTVERSARKEILLGDEIFNVFDENIDILEREFRFDMIRWRITDELTTFNYFDVDVVLAFLAKADILDRWLQLDYQQGKDKFDMLVKNLVAHRN